MLPVMLRIMLTSFRTLSDLGSVSFYVVSYVWRPDPAAHNPKLMIVVFFRGSTLLLHSRTVESWSLGTKQPVDVLMFHIKNMIRIS